VVYSLQIFLQKFCKHFLSLPPIPPSSPQQHLVRIKNYEAPHHAVYYILLLRTGDAYGDHNGRPDFEFQQGQEICPRCRIQTGSGAHPVSY